MSTEAVVDSGGRLGGRLLSLYARWTLWFVLLALALWAIGIEAVYAHPAPFYALWQPVAAAADWGELAPALAHAAVALAVFAVALALWLWGLRRATWMDVEPTEKAVRFFLLGAVVFAAVFPAVIAMIRGGVDGISAAYSRHTMEYIGDIGRGMSIRGLFGDYVTLHPYLSMHSKVHPPGPVALLWLLSYVTFSREALPLSIATIIAGALGVVPLYLWVREMFESRRIALTACALYTLMPTIVLFTATSADILFMPFTLATLWLFWRALHRRSIGAAVGAGLLYGVMSILSFSLLGMGAFFGIVGLWRLASREHRLGVVQTAVIMLAAFLVFHALLRWWSGFDMIEVFRISKAQFDLDQANLDLVTPRYPGWVYRFINPIAWLFFAGVPVTVLFVWRLARPAREHLGVFIVCMLMFLALDLLYLARGEGERSAMYIMPFLAIPAAHLLHEMTLRTRSFWPLGVTCAFLAVQCLLTEWCLNTFW